MHFVNCEWISQQKRSLCSSFIISFSLINPSKVSHVWRLVSGTQEFTDPNVCPYPLRTRVDGQSRKLLIIQFHIWNLWKKACHTKIIQSNLYNLYNWYNSYIVSGVMEHTEPKLCAYPLHTRVDGHRRKNFIIQFHSKNTYHTKFIQDLKNLLKIFHEHLGIFASFEFSGL